MENLEKQKNSPAKTSSNTEIILQDNQLVNDYDIDAYLAKRSEFIEKVNRIMVEGKDYHIIQTRKSMAKGGAEKIAAIFGWQAMFLPDDDTIKMLGTEKGVVAYICKLQKGSQFIGEGRGARSLIQDKGDVNKAIKMASKSAFVDAVLRSSGLSDFYTQDLEDIKTTKAPTTQNSAPTDDSGQKTIKATLKQINFVKTLIKQKGQTGKVSDEQINNLSLPEAKKWIDRLLKMENKIEDDIIQMDEIISHKEALLNQPYNYPEGD